jgi:hypothetical protein
MAVVSGQLKDASVNGKPRDLMDVIYNISPTDTPFLTMCGRTDATQTLHEWQTESLASPAANAQLEGADVSTFAEISTVELSNKTQILLKAINVSNTAQAIKQAGVDKQYAHQMALKSKELKKDVEFALLSNQLAAAEGGGAGRKMQGLPCWLWDNYDGGSGGASAVYGSSAAVAGTKRAITQALVTGMLTEIYEAGGNPDRIMAAPSVRVKLSSVLRGTADNQIEWAEKKKAYSVVDVFVSDFGAVRLIPNRVQAGVTYSQDAAFVIDPEYWKVAYLRGFREERLANTGDSMKGMINVECTLQASNPASSGIIADLDPDL